MNKFLSLAAGAALLLSVSSCKKSDDASPSSTPATSWSAKLLGAQNNSAGSFFSPTTGAVYLTGDSASFVANKVDISFAQIGATAATTTPEFVSPDARKAQALNKVVTVNRATKFLDLSSIVTKSDFDAVTNEDLDSLVFSGSSTATVAQGKIYGFSNAESKKGLIYVSNLDKGTGLNGSVTIDVKFQK